MKTKHLMLSAVATLAALTFTSCELEPYVITKEEQFTRAFIIGFGLIDPQQDWNMAQPGSVTVDCGSHANLVKVYALVDEEYQLVAKYTNVSGQVRIPFDMPTGTEYIKVDVDGQAYIASLSPSSRAGETSIGTFPTSERPLAWILAMEDMGSTDDFDFNDLVIGITSVATNAIDEKDSNNIIINSSDKASDNTWREVTFTALAAGGILNTYLYYNDVRLVPEGTNDGEWHSWFGNNPRTTMINTGHGKDGVKGKSITKYIKGFDLNKFLDKPANEVAGFKAKIEVTASLNQVETYDVTPAGTGAAPQMLLVPGSWKWPLERVDIRKAYKSAPSFKDWVSDAEGSSEWYQHPIRNQVYNK